MAERGVAGDEDIILPGEARYRMGRDVDDTIHKPEPIFTEPGTITRFQKMLAEANQIWVENKAQLTELTKHLPGDGFNKNPEILGLLLYMANRSEKAKSRRR